MRSLDKSSWLKKGGPSLLDLKRRVEELVKSKVRQIDDPERRQRAEELVRRVVDPEFRANEPRRQDGR